LAAPVTSIINSSLHQGNDQWKISRITPVPELFPPKHVESDVRSIAVTNAIAKIAEKFVSRYFNNFYDDYTDVNQFGCVHGRSTTHALLKVMHELFIAADCSKNIIRALFVDFSKAFDVIDHNVLSNGFISNNIPEHVWSPNFLNGRKQFVKIGTNSVSNTTVVGAGSPQGTVSIMTSNLL